MESFHHNHCIKIFCSSVEVVLVLFLFKKLDGVGSVDNRPSNNYLGSVLVVDLKTHPPPPPTPPLRNCWKVRQSGDFPTTLEGRGPKKVVLKSISVGQLCRTTVLQDKWELYNWALSCRPLGLKIEKDFSGPKARLTLVECHHFLVQATKVLETVQLVFSMELLTISSMFEVSSDHKVNFQASF